MCKLRSPQDGEKKRRQGKKLCAEFFQGNEGALKKQGNSLATCSVEKIIIGTVLARAKKRNM